ncbi:PrpF domain-containing protein [Pigmentibacter sp. JX0631]|uniref:PrpF domain-containing protein n=1 Tax=Pigmentibacter sp. JX0631 TaxID=2976982 RepID=UPI002468CB87|nr:PrpF domain-containing protein [Pigmentibacter sp. JX0631]WGL60471.1 PrpF domain-containing protein [Pigmentibacter sp. JX0631]
MNNFNKIPYMLLRGGTSKGPCFDWKYFPENDVERNKILLSIMGSPHPLQIDGIGSNHDLANKICLIRPSKLENIDVEYLLCQNHANSDQIETNLDCGNMLSAVAIYSLEMNYIKILKKETVLNIFSHNSKSRIEATISTKNKKINYEPDNIDNFEYGCIVKLAFLNPSGSSLGSEFPTGNKIDIIENTPVSCIDVSMPMVIGLAEDFNISGNETKIELDRNHNLMKKLETIRRIAASKMGMGNVEYKTSPKICLVSKAIRNGHINARYFISPFENNSHPTFAVTGAMCLGGSICIQNTLTNKLLKNFTINDEENNISIEHPSGTINVSVYLDNKKNISKISYLKSARPLSIGHVLIPKK